MAENIRVTADKAARFLRALEADARHLSPEDFANAAADDLPADDRERVEGHLAACAECQAEVDRLRARVTSDEASQQRNRSWQSFLAAAGSDAATAPGSSTSTTPALAFDPARTRRRREALAKLGNLAVPQPLAGYRVAAADRTLVADGTTDVQLEWQLNELDGGDLEAIFASPSPELAGATLTLTTRTSRQVVLTKVFGTSWMGRFVIPSDDWRSWTGRMVGRVVFADGEILSWD